MLLLRAGVADSIEADVDNLIRLLSLFGAVPRGMFLEEAVAVAKAELALECDYRHEAAAQARAHLGPALVTWTSQRPAPPLVIVAIARLVAPQKLTRPRSHTGCRTKLLARAQARSACPLLPL